uniref:RZ-type domain-containing protein n=1 Tax=Rhizophagus irregularis (strain DAOM 181602 / DAOM 197198 / MUCL 43194) TaxID=747089 RepID=U9UR50_RHIID
MYFLRDLRQRDFSIDDVRRFCETQKAILPWLGTLNWEDIGENRLPFNPYCDLPEYNEVEESFMSYHGINNKASFQGLVQRMNKPTITMKISLIGLFFIRLHATRASREWRHPDIQSANFLARELMGMDLPLEPNSSQLAMYLHRLPDCQNLFILTCISTAAEGVTRYVCKYGMKYFIANWCTAVTTSKCPNCGNTIGGIAINQAGSLPPASYCILHLIVHALIGASASQPALAFPRKNNQTATDAERNITETLANYLVKLDESLAKNQKNSFIESEICQTLFMGKQYREYMSNMANEDNYPFLSILFKYSGQLELLKHLLPIVKFVQILNSKLGYHLTRQNAKEMDFKTFLEKESDDDENHNSLKTAFEKVECIVYGLMESKDTGIFLCAILDYLVHIPNNFLEEVMVIPPGTCKSLKFLDEPTVNVEKTVSSTSKIQPHTSSGYYLQSIQRNLAVARGQVIVYDLTKIEEELANILAFEKFSKNPTSVTEDNISKILSSLEVLLCFITRTKVRDENKSIKDYVLQWKKLSSLYKREGFSKVLNIDLRLKHIVSLYELVEEQVADAKIEYIHKKYKKTLSTDMKTEILESIYFEQQTTTKKKVKKREMESLHIYLQDSSLNFWPSTIPEELVDELFPKNLLVANTYDAYKFTMSKVGNKKI